MFQTSYFIPMYPALLLDMPHCRAVLDSIRAGISLGIHRVAGSFLLPTILLPVRVILAHSKEFVARK